MEDKNLIHKKGTDLFFFQQSVVSQSPSAVRYPLSSGSYQNSQTNTKSVNKNTSFVKISYKKIKKGRTLKKNTKVCPFFHVPKLVKKNLSQMSQWPACGGSSSLGALCSLKPCKPNSQLAN